MVMRIEQRQPWTLIKLPVGHHLIDVRLRNALFWIIQNCRDALPFCIDNLFDDAAAFHKDIWLSLKESSIILRSQTEQAATLRHNVASRPCKRTGEHTGDILLEEHVHLKHQ